MVIGPKVIAFIPLRGGSKSIPLKNIKPMAGKPLAYWTIKAAIDCPEIEQVVISTDSDEIVQALGFIKSDKLVFFKRSPDTASDTASTESAMVEYFQIHSCTELVLIQATSPLLKSEDLSKAFRIYREQAFDSLISLVRMKRFLWEETSAGVKPINYDYHHRPRRQEFKGQLVENGAFYITRHSLFVQSRCRLNGKVGHYEMDPDSFFEIDEPSDWTIVEALLKKSLS